MDPALNYRGQMTIWIIVAVVIVASVVFFLFLNRGPIIGDSRPDGGVDITSYMQECIAPKVSEAADLMIPRGGFINPQNTVVFDGLPVEYLCLNQGNFEPCVHQHPVLLKEMRDEIYSYVYPEVDGCFEELRLDFSERNIDANYLSDFDFTVQLQEDLIILDITRETNLAGFGSSGVADDIVVEVEHPLYNLALIALEIANQEATYCYFEFVGYNVLYPRYEIEQFSMSDATTIYTIRDLETAKEMRIATRSCAISPGGG